MIAVQREIDAVGLVRDGEVLDVGVAQATLFAVLVIQVVVGNRSFLEVDIAQVQAVGKARVSPHKPTPQALKPISMYLTWESVHSLTASDW
ncbi:hypothetical protein EJD96_08790 [Herbaspirillum seropedicae]|uniref:hypothetical protein n=1 Tax=Herbaspirillum seropedicae TaxID=964 RepID=UPI00111FD9A4|nr:hypothetical protein [Herbaspirillum seropedicae]QDD64251.1 hypothetical protein EJD96_08790 [Herbaspirillum seropedicae]